MSLEEFEHEIETAFASFNIYRSNTLGFHSFLHFSDCLLNLTAQIRPRKDQCQVIQFYDNLSVDEEKRDSLKQILEKISRVMRHSTHVCSLDLDSIQNLLFDHIFQKK
jgi:hypothetical protein